jgi:hypothetical protein
MQRTSVTSSLTNTTTSTTRHGPERVANGFSYADRCQPTSSSTSTASSSTPSSQDSPHLQSPTWTAAKHRKRSPSRKPQVCFLNIQDGLIIDLQIDLKNLYIPMTDADLRREFHFLFVTQRGDHKTFMKNIEKLDTSLPPVGAELSPEACVYTVNLLRTFRLLGFEEDITARKQPFRIAGRLCQNRRIKTFYERHRRLFPQEGKAKPAPEKGTSSPAPTRDHSSTTSSTNYYTPLSASSTSTSHQTGPAPVAAKNKVQTPKATTPAPTPKANSSRSTATSRSPSLVAPRRITEEERRGRSPVKRTHVPKGTKGNRSNRDAKLVDASIRKTEQEEKGKADGDRESAIYKQEISSIFSGFDEPNTASTTQNPAPPVSPAPEPQISDIHKTRGSLIWSPTAFTDSERSDWISLAESNSYSAATKIIHRLIPNPSDILNIEHNLSTVGLNFHHVPNALFGIGADLISLLASLPSIALSPILPTRTATAVVESTVLTNDIADKRTDAEQATKLKHGTTISKSQIKNITESSLSLFGCKFLTHTTSSPSLEFVFSDEMVSQITSHANVGTHVPAAEAHERLVRAAQNITSVNVDRHHSGLPVRDGSCIYAEALHNDSQSRLLNKGLFHHGPNQTGSTPTATESAKSILPPFHLSSPQPVSTDSKTLRFGKGVQLCLLVVALISLGLLARTRISRTTSLWFAEFKSALLLTRQNLIRNC